MPGAALFVPGARAGADPIGRSRLRDLELPEPLKNVATPQHCFYREGTVPNKRAQPAISVQDGTLSRVQALMYFFWQ